MSPPVLIGFAGVLVAAVATGVLAGRCVRQPRIDFIVWTAATLALTIALAAQSMGFASGFGSVTFRAVQLFALLLAPLWLAWGLVELVAASEAARFGVRLVSCALTVVASVILATDPLSAQPFSKSWPLTSSHFEPIARYTLDVVQAAAVVAVLVSAGLAAARARSDPRWRAAMTAVVPVGLAVLLTTALRLSLPAGAAYPLLSLLAAALVWFGVATVGEPPRRAAGRDDVRDGRRDGVRDGSGRYRSGDRPDEAYAAADDYGPGGRYATYGPRGGPAGGPAGPARPRGTGDAAGAGGPARSVDGRGVDGRGVDGRGLGRRANSGPQPPEWQEWQDRYGSSGPGPDEPLPGPQPSTGGSPVAAPARPYGRILIFTLLDDRVADFDRLAEQTAEEVRTGEPDTLVYVIHLVPNAPMQRIFYEIYRDRAAFDSHESQPYMQRFVAECRSCVLATNVIELRLKYAKVAPLPNPQPSAPVPPPAGASAGPRGLPGAPGLQGTQRLQPLPPVRPPRPNLPRPDQRWPDQPRPDQPRPDQRQLPSAGRDYRG